MLTFVTQQNANLATRFAMAARVTFLEFFHASGDGLPMDVLDKLSQEHFDPVLEYIRMHTPDLIRSFYVKAADMHCAKLYTDSDTSPVTSPVPLAKASDLPPLRLGSLEIEMLYNRQTDEASLRIIRAVDLPVGNTYINLRLLPSFDGRPFKFRSTTALPDTSPRYNETVLVPDMSRSNAACVQIRIQARSLFQMDKVVGEVLLSTKALRRHSGSVVMLPLKPLMYDGELGWMQFAVMVSWEMRREPAGRMGIEMRRC